MFLRNFSLFLLSFAGTGLLAVASTSASCAAVELGAFGEIMNKWNFGVFWLTILTATIGGVYFPIGLVLAITGHRQPLRYYQRRLIQPFLTPALFQTAGLFAGIYVPLLNAGQLTLWVAFPLAVVALAVVSHSANELL